MSFTGDPRAIEALALKVQSLAESIPEAAKRGADVLRTEVQSEFSRRVDPYAKRWKPIKAKSKRTGRMQAGTSVVAVGNTIEMSAPSPAEYHQSGTRHMPARKILPDGDSLPTTYETAMDKATAEVVAKYEKQANG